MTTPERTWCCIQPLSDNPLNPELVEFSLSIFTIDDIRRWCRGDTLFGPFGAAVALSNIVRRKVVVTIRIYPYSNPKDGLYDMRRVGEVMWVASSCNGRLLINHQTLEVPLKTKILREMTPFSDVLIKIDDEPRPEYILCHCEIWPNDERANFTDIIYRGYEYDGLYYEQGAILRRV